MQPKLEQYLADRLSNLKTDRVNFNNTWERIARVVLPTAVGFNTKYAPGTNHNQDIFDSTAQLALPRYAAALDTLVTPQTSKWHTLQPKNRRLGQKPENARFLGDLNDLLFQVRYAPKANFASRASEVYTSQGAFGNGVMYIHDRKPGISYISLHLAECWMDESSEGIIDTMYWEHEYKLGRLMWEKPQWFEKLPENLRKDAEKTPNKTIKLVKAVYPRGERDTKDKTARNMQFASTRFMQCDSTPIIVEESGYRTFPFAVARGPTAPREVYAQSPAQAALADILTLQKMSKTNLRFGELQADPFYMAADADSVDPFVVKPGTINYGYLGPDGQERIKAMQLGGAAATGLTLEMEDQRRKAVNAAFLINLFQVLVETGSDRKTATEVMQLVQEKGALLAPIGGRLRTEFCSVIIEREIDILFNAGVVRPEQVPEDLRRNSSIDIEYDSPLTRAMKAEEGVGIMRSIEFAANVANLTKDASIMRKFNMARAVERVSEINGAPADILFTEEEMAERDQQDQAASAAQQTLEAAPQLAQTAKTLAEAQQIANKPAVI